jgi:hypothetical protein
MNGFLATRGRMSRMQGEFPKPTAKVLRYFHGCQFNEEDGESNSLIETALLAHLHRNLDKS